MSRCGGYDASARAARVTAVATWRAWRTKFAGREDSADAQKEKERLLQENAHTLLDGRITYTPLPKPP